MMVTLHVRIEGRVQGVFYRDSMIEAAARLGVDGWVRNCRDGTVEAVLRGDAAACDALVAWAGTGPPAARVLRVTSRAATEAETAQIGLGFRRAASV
jgi:acylphosphatase